MRTVAAGITTAEVAAALTPSHVAMVKNELLSFAAPALQTNAALVTTVPQTYSYNHANTHVRAAFRETDGTISAVVFDPATAANWALTQSATELQAATNPTAMRLGLNFVSETMYVYRAVASDSVIQLQRATLTGTSNPPTLGDWASYGATFGLALTNTSSLVRRVEAICPTDGGVIVAVGAHDYSGDLSTINFHWVLSDAAYQLNPIVQADLDDTYSTWYADAHWATHITALYDSATETIWVFCPMSSDGRTGTFSVCNGISSPIVPLLPVDNESTAAIFRASSVTTLNGRHHLCGRMTREMTDGSTVSFDCYLMSVDGEHWSIGERSFYLQSGDAAGALLLDAANHIVYYGGNLYSTSATATPLQDATSTQYAALGDIGAWQVQQITNGADSFSLTLLRGNAGLDNDPLVKPGAVCYLQTGQGGTVADFGVYGLDKPGGSRGASGARAVSIGGRDIAGKRLADWRAQFDMVKRGRSSWISTLASQDGLVIKTPVDQGYTFLSTGLQINGLNEPVFAFLDTPCTGDGLMKMTVAPTVTDSAHLTSFGALIGASDDGTGTAYLVPKETAWTDHVYNDARLRKLNLPAVDQDDPDALDAGFNLSPHTSNLWTTAGGTSRTAVSAAAYSPDTDTGIEAGTTYDVAIRTAGRRAQVFIKERDLSAANCSAAAGYTLHSATAYTREIRKMPAGKAYAGIAAGTDVFVDTDAFAHAMYDDVELPLTTATDYSGITAAAYTDLFSGTATVDNTQATDQIVLAGSYDIDEFAAGQRIRVVMNFSSHGDKYGVVESAASNIVTTVDNIVSGADQGSDTNTARVYLASAEEWGTATSGTRDRIIDGSNVTDNTGAAKAALLLWGAGAVVSTDNTAFEYDWWRSDGVTHYKLGTAYDATWPGGGGTDPSAWRFIFAHNALTQAWVSTEHGLPTSGYMMVDDEIVKYAEYSYTKFEQIMEDPPAVNGYMTAIPTYYTVLAGQSVASATVYNVWISSNTVGEGLDSAVITTGMLFEVTTREAPEQGFRMPTASGVVSDPPQYYIYGKSGSGETAAVVLGTYDAPLGTLSSDAPDFRVSSYEIGISSGRGAFGTAKTGHDPGAPVVYYPCSSTGAVASLLISRLEYHDGQMQTMEDAVKTICAWAGNHSVQVRNATTTPAADIVVWLDDDDYTVPLRENVHNFVLDLTAYIPDVGNALMITFRNYYKLHLWQTATSGTVRVGLETTSEDVDLDGAYRWLEWADVPLTDYDISAATSQNCKIRLAVVDNLIHVDICGQHAWTFNLDSLYDGETSYRADTDGAIVLAYVYTPDGNEATIHVQELSSPVEELAARKGEVGRGILDAITANRHVMTRSTATGGIAVSQFWTRDDAGTLQKNLLQDDWQQLDLNQSAHLQVVGAESTGEALDEATIRAWGYSFDAGQNDTLTTVAECAQEARLIIREGSEWTNTRSVTGYGRIAPQPEDLIELVYEPTSGAPTHASSDHVITSITLAASPAAVRGTYVLRDYVSTV